MEMQPHFSPISAIATSGFATTLLLLSWLPLVVYLSLDFISSAPHRVKLPGPAGQPVVGNLFQMRTGHARSLAHWTKLYGGIFRLALGEREAVIINTYADMNKTLVQQGGAFQSRPEFKLWHGAFTRASNPDSPTTIGTTKSSEKIGRYRRLLTPPNSPANLPSFNHFAARRYFRLVNLLSDSAKSGVAQDLGFHFWTTAVGTSANILFGQHFEEDMIQLIAETSLKVFSQRTLATPVHDYIPLVGVGERLLLAAASPMQFVLRPLGMSSWLDSFFEAEAQAKELRATEVGFCKQFLVDLHKRLDVGDPTPSQMGDILRAIDAGPGNLTPDEELRFATTMTGAGMGAGTALIWAASYLASHPEMQEKAFHAIEEVYGDETPDPLDTDRVEYIKALGMEAGRYFTSVRLGFPRETNEDVVVDGVFIPKGVLVVYNSYQINRDAQRYDLPDEFIPERWMDGHYGRTDMEQPKVGVPHLTHGAGRRVCMGITHINKMLYGNLVLLLHFFKLERGPLGEAARAAVFPKFRDIGEMSLEAHPIDDQVSVCDSHATPLAAGIKLTARDPHALVRWIAEGHLELDQWHGPNLPGESVFNSLQTKS